MRFLSPLYAVCPALAGQIFIFQFSVQSSMEAAKVFPVSRLH
jgi:hypothetical protein